MKNLPLRWSLLILACALASACQDRRDPVKPTVSLAAPSAIAALA